MGIWFSKLYKLIKGPKPARILMVGLDAAGKTTITQRLRFGEPATTVPTMGFNVDEVEYGSVRFTVWDVGGQGLLRKFWPHYYDNNDAIIFVVDSSDRERLDLAREELWKLVEDEKLGKCLLLVYANKQDLPRALDRNKVADGLGIEKIKGKKWRVQPAIATNGVGLIEGLD
eukprot:TRINITY_DN4786_c0_g7_i1.p1 TRINITY_DN4786_c0_g7~~TRINITY_DN4786_c0_g7_i1.p1  ORF type:complete len:172 (-),score=50.41 TRINITY_DN4786_c0_g7_i1:125-640(-)